MTDQAFPDLRAHVTGLLRTAVAAVTPEQVTILVERPKQAQHGDDACNAAMQLAKLLKRNPRDIAAALIAALPVSSFVDRKSVV